VSALRTDAPAGRFGLACCPALTVAQHFDLPPCGVDNDANNGRILEALCSDCADDFEAVDLGGAGDVHWIRLFRFRLTL
jgi:hypothetical protein